MEISADGWVAVLTGVGVVVTLASGFTVWMKRIDRALVKAVLQAVSATNQAFMFTGMQYTFDGTSSTATPGLIQLMIQSTAGTMSAATPVKCPRTDESETLQTSFQYNASAEPSAGNVLRMWHCHPQLGFIYEPPYGGYFKCVGGGRIGAKLNFPATVNVMPSFWGEE
jgi:hypothetical protein